MSAALFATVATACDGISAARTHSLDRGKRDGRDGVTAFRGYNTHARARRSVCACVIKEKCRHTVAVGISQRESDSGKREGFTVACRRCRRAGIASGKSAVAAVALSRTGVIPCGSFRRGCTGRGSARVLRAPKRSERANWLTPCTRLTVHRPKRALVNARERREGCSGVHCASIAREMQRNRRCMATAHRIHSKKISRFAPPQQPAHAVLRAVFRMEKSATWNTRRPRSPANATSLPLRPSPLSLNSHG